MVDNNRLLQKLTIQTCFYSSSRLMHAPSAHEVNTPASKEADPPALEEANTPASEEANEPASYEAFTISKRESATPNPSNRTGEEDAMSLFGGDDFENENKTLVMILINF